MTGISSFEQISVGYQSVCAIADTGEAYCWGSNGTGNLGDGSTTNRNKPTAVTMPSGVSSFVEIVTGSSNTCAVGDNNKTYCWGINNYGQVGDGGASGSIVTTPTEVTMPSGVSTLTNLVDGGAVRCGMGDDSQIYCWGYGGFYGPTAQPTLEAMPAGVTATYLTAGGEHICAIGDDDAAYCWLVGGSGQIGDGNTANRLTPAAVNNTNYNPSTEITPANTCGECVPTGPEATEIPFTI